MTLYNFSDRINLEMEAIDMASLTTAINVNVDTKTNDDNHKVI